MRMKSTDKQRAEAALTHNQQTCQPDIHTVLREMSTMMAEQRVELRHTNTELGAMEARLRASESRLTDSESRLTASESRLTASESRLTASESRLTASESRLTASETSESRLTASESRLTASESRLTASESQVEELKVQLTSKVAFSASLAAPGQGGNTGPFNTGITLVYRNIYSNIGNIINVIIHCPASHVVISSNGVLLDVVNMHLWAGKKIYDDGNHHGTFSGHLLFTM
uniref:C1q domain-containing protein n=1 Tax=Oncorhynchus tshawytscha TaxID=74940 RepID=A0AAZ3RLQ5_ONCTS